MDSHSWTQRYQYESDSFDEMDGDTDDKFGEEFMCPFCGEDFDMVGLCCHMDEDHKREAKNGVCPVCTNTVGMDLVGHITMQHGSLLKVQRKRRFRKGGLSSALTFLRKELRGGSLESLLDGSSCLVSSSNTEPDPWLSSFMYNPPVVDEPTRLQLHSLTEASSAKESSAADFPERNVPQLHLLDKVQEERARKCEFVQGLLLSTFLDDGL